MRRALVTCVTLAACVILASAAFGIAAGPTGRIYLTERTAVGVTNYVNLRSFTVNAAWAGSAVVNHGNLMDNSDGVAGWQNHPYYGGITPEVEQPGGVGYGTLVMGLYFNNSPAPTAPPRQTMDVVRILPSAGSYATTVLGDGRANPGGWPVGPSTEDGMMALPNQHLNGALNTDFTGAANRYITSDSTWKSRYHIAQDTNGDGDVTDDANDYVVPKFSNSGAWAEIDFELYKNRLFASSNWSANYSGNDGIYYYESTGGATPTVSNEKVWYKGSQYYPTDPPHVLPQPGIPVPWATKFAVGQIKDVTGAPHTAVWSQESSFSQIILRADYNNDGDAMDNAATIGRPYHEYRKIYDAASTPKTDDDPQGLYGDIELVTNAGGVNFLLFYSANRIIVVQLADNGEFAGYGQANPDDFTAVINNVPFGWNFEFDSELNVSAQIPEPGTMLLIGTGALGIFGWIRRRKMS